MEISQACCWLGLGAEETESLWSDSGGLGIACRNPTQVLVGLVLMLPSRQERKGQRKKGSRGLCRDLSVAQSTARCGATVNGCLCLKGMLAASLGAGEEVWEAQQHCTLPALYVTCL